jgi:hypothetical protein
VANPSGVPENLGGLVVNRLLGSVQPLLLLALAALVLWVTWDLGSQPQSRAGSIPAKTTGPSLERAIAAMGQDPAEAIGP